MPDLLDRIYCSEQIHIPPTFPYIMKLYCKAAIRTQPYDLLKWSAAYFRALANGEEPPAKERVEYPPYDSPTGLTPGYIKILINQFGKDPSTTVTAQTLFQKWSGICLQEHVLIKLLALLGAKTTVNWVQFVGICAGFISKTLTQTMILICELFTEEPEGGMATIPYELFIDLYIFLAEMECGPLTEAEKEEMEGIMKEEDICDVAEKIKEGYYGEGEGEGEGDEEYIYREERGEEGGEEMLGEQMEEETIKMEEEQPPSRKVSEVQSVIGEFEGKEGDGDEQGEGEQTDQDERKEDDVGLSESSFKEGSGEVSNLSNEGEGIPTRIQSAEEIVPETEEKTEVEETKEDEEVGEEEEEVEKPKPKKIVLEDLEESIREKIKKKLEEDEETQMDEEEREFEDLDSYLLGTATRVHKYTADILGFKIFKKYMRQDVPGIGPRIESEQVEKVVEFFDFWSHKQETMVMPRNIRHWMCPPLDKIPTPEP